MRFSKVFVVLVVALAAIALMAPAAMAKKPSVEKWKPAFDYSGAKYKIKVSNVSHPAIKGVYAGFAIRDALWKATKGQIYFEYLPFSMLGGEVEVLNQLQMGAIQGMAVSSVASTNLGPRMGLVNLPFLVNSYEKLDKFIANKKLFQHFLDGMEHQGIMGLDVTAYGRYGWATTVPVKNIADAKQVKFRIAEAAVNKLLYKSWGFNPVVMPWPDVPTALKQGVITGLDHTLIVCYLTRKFEVAKNFTPVNYAQGLFIWIFNKAWFKSLPADLQATFTKVVNEQCAIYRNECKAQEAAAKKGAIEKSGVKFWELSKKDLATLQYEGNVVHQQFAKEIGPQYLGQVQEFLGYKITRDMGGKQ
ncbi:MAG: TRAP transporter substrate-binding protein [Proteobacteria bacterium]|nr:TRAP transporter substrate-binding protein [Pseudomonadota bacterium]